MYLNSNNLNRFIDAQEGVYPIALKELQEGLEEAAVYLEHLLLGHRIREVSETILNLPGNDAKAVFGGIDAMKLRSSMTLFDVVSPNDIFARVLDKYFNGERDRSTIVLLNMLSTDE